MTLVSHLGLLEISKPLACKSKLPDRRSVLRSLASALAPTAIPAFQIAFHDLNETMNSRHRQGGGLRSWGLNQSTLLSCGCRAFACRRDGSMLPGLGMTCLGLGGSIRTL